MNGPDEPVNDSARGGPAGVRHFLSHRTLWHGIGLLLALAIAWLILLAYRRPDFLLDIANLSFC